MELKDTIDMMISSDHKERFRAEYFQTKIRLEKLRKMCKEWDKGLLDFTPMCDRSIYDIQMISMESYLDVLRKRALFEDIILKEPDNGQ